MGCLLAFSLPILSSPSSVSSPSQFFLHSPFISSPSPVSPLYRPSSSPFSPFLTNRAPLHPRFQTYKTAKLLSSKTEVLKIAECLNMHKNNLDVLKFQGVLQKFTNNTLQHVCMLRVSKFQTEC